jgi:hypothetical protein
LAPLQSLYYVTVDSPGGEKDPASGVFIGQKASFSAVKQGIATNNVQIPQI